MSDPAFLLAENQRLKAELDQVRTQIFPQMRTLLGQLERLKGERKNMRTLLSSIYLAGDGPVSYTHLTLPTILLV